MMMDALSHTGNADCDDEASVTDTTARVRRLLEVCGAHLDKENHDVHRTTSPRSVSEPSLFVAVNFQHMVMEESVNNDVLWAHFDDGEIIALHDENVASIPPEKADVARPTRGLPSPRIVAGDAETISPCRRPTVDACENYSPSISASTLLAMR